jgi:hypothetical protein
MRQVGGKSMSGNQWLSVSFGLAMNYHSKRATISPVAGGPNTFDCVTPIPQLSPFLVSLLLPDGFARCI